MTVNRLTEAELKASRERFIRAAAKAREVLKPGDRLRVTKCPGTKRWITFAGMDGDWICSKSGINDYSPSSVDRINQTAVDLGAP